jgi:hypothetical protein
MRSLIWPALTLLCSCNCFVPVSDLDDAGRAGGQAHAGGAGGASGGSAGGAAAAGGIGGGTAGGTAGGGTAGGSDGGCYTTQRIPSGMPPDWQTGSCPDAGCPAQTFCLRGFGEGGSVYGCAPVPASCQGTPSCACMGCLCSIGCADFNGVPECNNGTISRRAFKEDVTYVTDREAADLARQTLSIPLARYRYQGAPPGARMRLGFIIDDQPNPSAAVSDDRMSVDTYGYTSMLLATVQQQQRELAELRRRLSVLERNGRCDHPAP